MLRICALFDAVPAELSNDCFLIDISMSQSSAQSIAEYVRKFYSEEQFLRFADSQSRSFRPMRLFELLACVIPDSCVHYFLTTQIQLLRGDDIDHDRSTAIALCAANNRDVRPALAEHRSEWLERFLLHDNSSKTRTLAKS